MKKLKTPHWLIPVIISVLVFILLLATNPDIGLTWDEPAYIAASESYMGWFTKLVDQPADAITAQEITNAWQINSEHPPLDKVWSGVIWSIARNFTDDLTAHRMGNMLLVAILTGILYFWMRESYGQIAGFASVAALLTMPRFFFHAHLSSLDVPAAFSVFVVTFMFWKIKDSKGWAWAILLGVIWGLALATKVNAVFIPLTLGLWWLIFNRSGKLFLRLVIMGITAIPVFLAVWPWLYVNTIERLVTYIGFITTDHWQIGQYYAGQFYLPPPWHFGFAILWAVLPLGITILYFTGLIRSGIERKDGGLVWLMFISAMTPVIAIAVSKSMVYDNERMYMAAFPFLAGLAGSGFAWLASKLNIISQKWQRKLVINTGVALIAVLFFIPQLVTMVRLYPHYLSYYGEGVGGISGANKLGFETTYWCETYSLAFPIINEQAEENARIWADPWSHDVLIYYQLTGKLRKDLVIVAPFTTQSILGPNAPQPHVIPMNLADWYIVQQRQSTLGFEGEENEIPKILKGREKVMEYAFDGVTIFELYKK